MGERGVLALIGTGVALGIVHVLTGPDHLSALATLSANVSSQQAFWLGVRWGVGHSSGLLLVGIILIVHDASTTTYNQSKNDKETTIIVPDSLSHLFETFVGIFMLCLGLYGMNQACRTRQLLEGRELLPTEDNNDDEEMPTRIPMEESAMYDPEEDMHTTISHRIRTSHADDGDLVKVNAETKTIVRSSEVMDEVDHNNTLEHIHDPLELEIHDSLAPHATHHPHHHHHIGWNSANGRGSMAILAGIIHGLAGPGGVLGVVPAVQLHAWKLASLYLASFCVSSTLTMGGFATLYGTCSSCLVRGSSGFRISSSPRQPEYHRLEYSIQLFSASLSILVGITWLVLLYFGKLEDVFP